MCLKLSVGVILFLLTRTTCQQKLRYTWPIETDKYDTIAGISYKGIPVCAGVFRFFSRQSALVVTSSNAIAEHVGTENVHSIQDKGDLKIHYINGQFDRSEAVNVFSIAHQSQRFKFENPLELGIHYNPIHDVAYLWADIPPIDFNKPNTRRGVKISYGIHKLGAFEPEGTFYIAGFGFMNREHVKSNIQLEYREYKVNDVYENCDEWVPRHFGIFICILNVDNFVGVGSGSPLFYYDQVVGIGAFSVSRGDESVLLFTDITRYNRSYMRYRYIRKP